MDNEGLLAWGEYEVERAREVLERAKAHTGELREIVRLEKEELAGMARYISYIEKLGVPRKAWMAASSLEELLVMVTVRKAFLMRNGYSEEELKL